MNVNAAEFTPRNPPSIAPMPYHALPMYAHEVMAQLEGLEHCSRVTKYNLELLEGNSLAKEPPTPLANPKKGFTFVDSSLRERLNDLARSQNELYGRVNELKMAKRQVTRQKNCVYCVSLNHLLLLACLSRSVYSS